jgi:ribosomal protein L11 methyltransferase
LHALCDLLDANRIPFERILVEPDQIVVYAQGQTELTTRTTLLSDAGYHGFDVEPFDYDPGAWVETWKEHFHWVKISHRLCVGPVFKPCPYDCQHKITIDPGQSFGTGTHESTRIALFFLDGHLRPGQTVCDVGCGSGVLSFAAQKITGIPPVAFDFDRESCFDCARNAALNSSNPLIFRGGTAPIEAQFDFVAANILGHILLTVTQDVRKMVRPGGLLLLSGLTTKDKPAFERKFFTRSGEFKILDSVTLNEWWGAVWQKVG